MDLFDVVLYGCVGSVFCVYGHFQIYVLNIRFTTCESPAAMAKADAKEEDLNLGIQLIEASSSG